MVQACGIQDDGTGLPVEVWKLVSQSAQTFGMISGPRFWATPGNHDTLDPFPLVPFPSIPSVATAIEEMGFPAIAMEAFKCDH